MKRLIVLPVLLISLFIGRPVSSADLVKGIEAYKRGDYATVLEELRPLAEEGLATAQYILGAMYADGKGVQQDNVEALKWLKLAAGQGHKVAARAVQIVAARKGPAFSPGFRKGVDAYKRQDYAAAAKIFKKFGRQGDVNAQTLLCSMNMSENQGGRDYKVAFKWCKLAAEQGMAGAQSFLGTLFDQGNGVAQDYKAAFKWYKLAAQQGYVFAQNDLGRMYAEGKGVAQDYKAAFKWHMLAAKQGNAWAQFSLSRSYALGHGIPQDDQKAFMWEKRAAEQGEIRAQVSLSIRYNNGTGVPMDDRASFKWIKLAAEQEAPVAQFQLGVKYGLGKGVERNDAAAEMWFRRAANKGYKEAYIALDVLARDKAMKKSGNSEGSQNRATPTPPIVTKPFPFRPVDVRFRASTPNPDDIAVIIGNADYKKQGKDIPNVTPAYADAEGIKRYFKDALGVKEGNIIHLKDATGSHLISLFGNSGNHKGKLFNWVKPGQSNVYVYYAGHGAPAGDEGSAYMIPSDSTVDSIELTGYPLATLYKNLGKIGAKSVTVILEACFSGAGQGGTLIKNASPVYLKAKTPKIPSNLTVISAGTATQIASWEKDKTHSLFTKYFLKGMSGEADVEPYGNGDGKVNYTELGKYLDGTMTYFARRYYGRDQTAQIVNGSL